MVHLIALDFDLYYPGEDPCGEPCRQAQLYWLRQDLQLATAAAARAKTPWIVMTAHFPVFCTGCNGNGDAVSSAYYASADAERSGNCNATASKLFDQSARPQSRGKPVHNSSDHLVKDIAPLLKEFGVDLFVAGHWHYYESLWPGIEGTPTCKACLQPLQKDFKNPMGTVHITTGNGGPPGKDSFVEHCSHPKNTTPPEDCHNITATRAQSLEYGYGQLLVHNASVLEFTQFENENQTIVDHFVVTVAKHGPFTTPFKTLHTDDRAATGPACSGPCPWISQPFVAGVGGYQEYRIPSLVALPNNGLLAFAEGRKLSCADVDWNDIVSRRSTDGGATWEPQVLVHGESTSKRHVCIGNPSPAVVHSKPGRVVLCGTRQLQEGFSVISEDYGKTWGKAVYQSALVAKNQRGSGAPQPVHGQAASNWTFYMPGPAAGFQLPGGRLVVGAYHGFCAKFSSPGKCEKAGGAAFAFPIISDDEGATWSWENGHAYDVGGTGAAADGESQVAPAPNGSLIMRTRTARHQPPGMAWSNDNGMSWTKVLPWTNDTAHAAIYQNYTCACAPSVPFIRV